MLVNRILDDRSTDHRRGLLHEGDAPTDHRIGLVAGYPEYAVRGSPKALRLLGETTGITWVEEAGDDSVLDASGQ